MSESDSDCELYTKTALHVKFRSRVEEIEDVVDLASGEELGQFYKEVDAGMSPMKALLKVQSEHMIRGHMDGKNVFTTSGSNTSRDQPASIDLTSFDWPVESLHMKEKNSLASGDKSVLPVLTRASTRRNTRASLLKAKKSFPVTSNENADCASDEVDARADIICQSNVSNETDVVQQEGSAGQGSVTRGSKSKRGRPSRSNRRTSKTNRRASKSNRRASKRQNNTETNSNVNNLDTIVFDDDSAYNNTMTTPIDFNKRYSSKLSITPLNYDSSSDTDEDPSDNIPVKISIEWSNEQGMTRKNFQLRKYQKFGSVFEELAKLEGIPLNRVILMQNFTSINPNDSPESLDMKFYGALTGFVSKTEVVHGNMNLSAVTSGTNKPENTVSVKIQLESKQTFVFNLAKNSKMDTLYLMVSEELKCDKDKLRLVFDGEIISPCDKLSNLDVEDGDVFHAYIKK